MSRNRTTQTITIPLWFLEETAPTIREISELQVMLAVFRLQDGSADHSEPVAESQLRSDRALRDALRLEGASRAPDDQITRGLELAVARDSLLAFSVQEQSGSEHRWFLIATPANRLKLEHYRTGQQELPQVVDVQSSITSVERARPGIFQLYEQNIGLVTPIIADRLVEALELYPQSWIEDAIEAAVSYNKRSWRYVQRILETWATEGRNNETNRRNQSTARELDPERHLTGEYAAIFRRRRRE
jgi:DNA replication protein